MLTFGPMSITITSDAKPYALAMTAMVLVLEDARNGHTELVECLAMTNAMSYLPSGFGSDHEIPRPQMEMHGS